GGREGPGGPKEKIPIGDLRAEMVERRARPPISATHLPKVVVRVDGNLGISPAHRVADYRGTHWSSIECDSTRLKQAFPKPLRVERRMLNEAEQLYAEGGSELAPPTEPRRVEPVPPPEPAPCQERPHLRLVSGARSGEIEAPAQSTPEAGTGPEEAPVSAANAALKPIEPAATESVSEWPSAEQLGIMK